MKDNIMYHVIYFNEIKKESRPTSLLLCIDVRDSVLLQFCSYETTYCKPTKAKTIIGVIISNLKYKIIIIY